MVIYGLSVPAVYIWDVVGSAGVELSAAVSAASANDGAFPPKYYRWAFLLWRIGVALFAGTIPLALDAIWLGASAPLFFARASRGLDPPPT